MTKSNSQTDWHTHRVPSKRKSNPVIPLALTLLLDRLDISLLLEHLCVLRHVLGALERVKVPHVRLAVEDGDEGGFALAEGAEGQGREEWEGLDVLQCRHAVLRVGDESAADHTSQL